MVICSLCILKGDFPKEERLPDTNNRSTSKTESKSQSSLYPPQAFDLPDFPSLDTRRARYCAKKKEVKQRQSRWAGKKVDVNRREKYTKSRKEGEISLGFVLYIGIKIRKFIAFFMKDFS